MKKRLIILGFLTFLLLFNAGCTFWYKTSSTEIGVKVNKLKSFLGKNAVSERIAEPSRLHAWFPFVYDFYVFDTSIQTIEMSYDISTGDLQDRDDLLFKTIDGNDISLDIVIQYQIVASKAPYILQYIAPNNKELKYWFIRSFARSLPRDIFGELKTEEFYEQLKRQEKAQKVKTVLNKILEPYGIIVHNVLSRDYRFNPAYQKAIEDKKVADQLVEKNRSAKRATVEEYRKKLEEAKGEVNKLIAEVDGEYEKSKLEADAYYFQQETIAKAILFEANVESQAILAKNKALAAAGGEILVKLEMAKALKDKKIIVIPTQGGMNLKTMNFNELIKVYGVKSLDKTSVEKK
ncbi:prohibitin family protein [Candidatus Margulisiibacteriota bacterium]